MTAFIEKMLTFIALIPEILTNVFHLSYVFDKV